MSETSKDPAYPPSQQYPTQPSAPYPVQDTSAQNVYPPTPGYPYQTGYSQQQQQGYPTAQSGYPQAQQGYATQAQTYVPQAVYTPHGQVMIKTGAPSGHSPMIRETQTTQPNDYLCFSIFVMLCCCLPFGIIALIKSMDVRSFYSSQNYDASTRASTSAKNWNVAGLVTGLVIQVLTIIIFIVWFVVFGNAASDLASDYYG